MRKRLLKQELLGKDLICEDNGKGEYEDHVYGQREKCFVHKQFPVAIIIVWIAFLMQMEKYQNVF